MKQQKLIEQKKLEISRRARVEEQSRKKRIQSMPNNDWELWGQALHDWKEFTRKNPKKMRERTRECVRVFEGWYSQPQHGAV